MPHTTHRTVSTTLLAVGAFVLLLCLAFTVVQIACSDYGFFEKEFIKLKLSDSMGMTVGDISKGLRALVEYMNGKVDSIDVDVMIGGVKTPMYALEIEHVHMEEVRTVWQRFETARNMGLLLTALLAIGALLADNEHMLRNTAVGYLWALGAFLVIALFAGVWAGTNFNSFWTQFHRLLFPNSENWILPNNSRMIQMLPAQLFSDLVMHCGVSMLLLFMALGAAAVTVLVLLQKKKQKAVPQLQEQREEEPQIPEQEGPDLVTMHRLLNMSVTRRRKAEAELAAQKAQAEKEAQAKRQNEETQGDEPIEGQKKIEFAAYADAEKEAAEAEEEEEEAAWIRSFQKAEKKLLSGKKKKKPVGKKKSKGEKTTKSKKQELSVQTEEMPLAADKPEEAEKLVAEKEVPAEKNGPVGPSLEAESAETPAAQKPDVLKESALPENEVKENEDPLSLEAREPLAYGEDDICRDEEEEQDDSDL